MKYQTNPTRLEAIWLDVTKRNPKQPGETFKEYLERLSNIMATARREEAEEAR